MAEVKITGPSMQERIAARLRNSGEGANPDVTVKKGESPNRVFHNIHLGATQSAPMNKRGNDSDRSE